MKKEKEDKIKELRAIKMAEKVRKYKLQHHLICEEERLNKLRKEEEARKLEGFFLHCVFNYYSVY